MSDHRPLFNGSLEAHDELYRLLRDDPECAHLREFADRLWEKFEPYADTHFRRAIADSFHSRFWEMYLAFGLLNSGCRLLETSIKPGRFTATDPTYDSLETA